MFRPCSPIRPYRARTVARLGHDTLLQGFWSDYNELSRGGRAALIGPIMNKLRAVLMRPFVRDALSGSASTVDLGEILNSGGLILARAAKGMLGEDASRLLGSLLLAHTWQAITPRASVPEHARRDAVAYIDEAHNFLNLPGSVSDILAESRAYRLSLVIAHQHLSQLPRDLRDAVSADARNKMYFAISPEDARPRDRINHTRPVLAAQRRPRGEPAQAPRRPGSPGRHRRPHAHHLARRPCRGRLATRRDHRSPSTPGHAGRRMGIHHHVTATAPPRQRC